MNLEIIIYGLGRRAVVALHAIDVGGTGLGRLLDQIEVKWRVLYAVPDFINLYSKNLVGTWAYL